MNKVRRRPEPYSLYERTALAAHLEKLAAKGWMLEKIGSFFWTYRRTEPKKLSFCVCFFPKASEFDPGPSEEQQTFYDFCAHTGWKLAASAAQLQVFYNERENPVPIETDPLPEIDTIHRTALRSVLPAQFLLLAVSLLNGALFAARLLSDPVGVLSDTASLFTGAVWTLLFLETSSVVAGHFLWRRQAVRAAQRGEFRENRSIRLIQLLFLALFAVFFCIYLFYLFSDGSRLMKTAAFLMFCLYLPGFSLRFPASEAS